MHKLSLQKLGIAVGGFSVIIPLYLSEITEPRLRGHIGYSYMQQTFTGGLVA